MTAMAKQAGEVTRVCAGIPQRLKGCGGGAR